MPSVFLFLSHVYCQCRLCDGVVPVLDGQLSSSPDSSPEISFPGHLHQKEPNQRDWWTFHHRRWRQRWRLERVGPTTSVRRLLHVAEARACRGRCSRLGAAVEKTDFLDGLRNATRSCKGGRNDCARSRHRLRNVDEGRCRGEETFVGRNVEVVWTTWPGACSVDGRGHPGPFHAKGTKRNAAICRDFLRHRKRNDGQYKFAQPLLSEQSEMFQSEWGRQPQGFRLRHCRARLWSGMHLFSSGSNWHSAQLNWSLCEFNDEDVCLRTP